MGKAYSQDLRERVIAAVDGGTAGFGSVAWCMWCNAPMHPVIAPADVARCY